MYNNEFFVVDMASCQSTGEIINSLSLALETLGDSGKKIVLKLNDSYLNQSQLLSIQSLITSYGCTLDTVETTNKETRQTAENMNILVQVPVEPVSLSDSQTSFEEKFEQTPPSISNTTLTDFKPFSIDNSAQSDEIALKEVSGLHFEADLDVIQKQQDNINIISDLKGAGINPGEDFKTIEDKVSNQYTKPDEIVKTVDEMSKLNNAFSQEGLITNITSQNEVQEDNYSKKDDDFANAEKKSINVYKKAYDENKIQNEQWDEVDFYETATNEPVVSDTKHTTYINQTLRSGQILEAEGNVVIIGDCHPGSEVRAVGDITVWGVLSGIAHAGYKGNSDARVRALKLNAVQLRIGNCYSRRPDGTNVPYIIRSSVFTPEEARIVDGEIVLFKINQN